MSVRNMESLFQPKSIAVFGTRNDTDGLAARVVYNLRACGFPGPVIPISAGASAVASAIVYPDSAHLPFAPDLAVLCTPFDGMPALIDDLGRRGTRGVIILSGDRETGCGAESPIPALLEAARPHLVRILGPASFGVMAPHLGMNASVAKTPAAAGKIAFVTQSRALASAALRHAAEEGIGFSYFLSLGGSADVDLGDVLDYLAGDATTRAVLIHAETIDHARKLMSSARAAARNKPVLVVKAGRGAASGSEDGKLTDLIVDAAIRRAGMLRVATLSELFDAVETLAFVQRLRGDRVAVLANGKGPGLLAIDALERSGGIPASLTPKTRATLADATGCSQVDPGLVDLLGDATADRYGEVLTAVLGDQGVDTALVIHAPLDDANGEEVAERVARAVKASHKAAFACWLGRDRAGPTRKILADANIPTYDSPEDAIRAVTHVTNYWKNQETLIQTPSSVADGFVPDTDHASAIVRGALAQGRDRLTIREVTQVFRSYAIPMVDTLTAKTPDDAARLGEALGFPIALKLLSATPGLGADGSDVALDLGSVDEVRHAAEAMIRRLRDLNPHAQVEGFHVREMIRRPDAIELSAGAFTDPIFGPVIQFGHGGAESDLIADWAIALPPLNMALAAELIGRTRVARLLGGFHGREPAYVADVQLTLVKLAYLMADIPAVHRVEINPLLADGRGVLAISASMTVAETAGASGSHLAIKPYPKELEERVMLGGRPVVLRPIRPEDEPEHRHLLERISPDDIRFRFFTQIRQFAHTDLARFTQIDYDREMAFIASAPGDLGQRETLGVVRTIADPNNDLGEFAILVRSDLKGKGLGRILMEKMVRYARRRGLAELRGQVLSDNLAMRGLAERIGFKVVPSADPGVMDVSLHLDR